MATKFELQYNTSYLSFQTKDFSHECEAKDAQSILFLF